MDRDGGPQHAPERPGSDAASGKPAPHRYRTPVRGVRRNQQRVAALSRACWIESVPQAGSKRIAVHVATAVESASEPVGVVPGPRSCPLHLVPQLGRLTQSAEVDEHDGQQERRQAVRGMGADQLATLWVRTDTESMLSLDQSRICSSSELIGHPLVQLLPHPGFPPVAHPPGRVLASCTQLRGQVPPPAPGMEHDQDSPRPPGHRSEAARQGSEAVAGMG